MLPVHQNLRFAFAALLFFSGSALAAPSWQGPYLGAYLGGGFANNDLSTNAGRVSDTSYFTTSADIKAVNNAGSWTKNPGTGIAGILIGHDWTWQQLVYGVAMDYSVLPLSSSSTTNNTFPDNSDQYSVNTSMQTNWLFTLRGRLGYQTNLLSLPNFVYLTGGMAMTNLKVKNSFSDNSALAGTASNTVSQNQIGWTAGAGVEIAVHEHVSVDLEYLYVSVPSVKTNGSIANANGGFGIPPQSLRNPFSSTANFYATIFKVGVNYRFDE